MLFLSNGTFCTDPDPRSFSSPSTILEFDMSIVPANRSQMLAILGNLSVLMRPRTIGAFTAHRSASPQHQKSQ
jgi:hypothetical protein